jgi:membrane protein implicated in regulation of membrane protease activity
METAYLLCAAVGGTLIVCQFVMTLLGIGGDHDVGGGHDVGGHDFGGHDVAGHHEVGHGAESSWFFSMLSFRTLSAAVAFFGLAGLAAHQAELDRWQTLGIALAAGAVAFFLVGWLMRMLIRLNVDGTARIERAVGSRGTVYLPVPAGKSGVGKVHVSMLNRTIEYRAITAQDQLPTGAKVVVVGIVAPDTVEVASATESERTAYV